MTFLRTPGGAAAVAVALCAGLHAWLCALMLSDMALDLDSVNLVYAIERFDVAHQAPHPPGYLLYVWCLRAVHAVIGGELLATVQWLAIGMSCITIGLVHAVVRALGASPATGVLAALLCALHPFLIFHSVDGQTHNAEAMASALLLLCLIAYRRTPDRSRAVLLGLVLALGAGLRPSFVVMAVLPVLLVMAGNLRHLGLAVAAAIAGAMLWIVPTVALSGGLDALLAAHNAFVGEAFLANASLRGSLAPTLSWSVLLALPLLASWPLCRAGEADGAELWARRTVLAMAALGLPFYLLTYSSEPGYLQALVPPLAVWTALRVGQRATRPGLALSLAVAAQLAVLVMPTGSAGFKWPSISELVQREVTARAYHERAIADLSPGQQVLVVTDYPGQAIQRQLPLLQPGMHVLWLYWRHSSALRETTLGFGTDVDMQPIPGPALLMSGRDTIFDTGQAYAWVQLDPFLSDAARAQLREQSPCAIPPRSTDGLFTRLSAARCFPTGIIRFEGQGVRFTHLSVAEQAKIDP